MNNNTVVLGTGSQTQISFYPIEERESRGGIRLASQQNPRNFLGTQMREKRLHICVKKGKIGIVLLEIRADEIDNVVGVLGLGEKVKE